MVSCDALVRSGVPFLPGLTMVPQNEDPDIAVWMVGGLSRWELERNVDPFDLNARRLHHLCEQLKVNLKQPLYENNQNPYAHTHGVEENLSPGGTYPLTYLQPGSVNAGARNQEGRETHGSATGRTSACRLSIAAADRSPIAA